MANKFINRLCRHLFILPHAANKKFPSDVLRRIEAAIAVAEKMHAGEIRFAVELNLPVLDIFRKKSAKKRAIEVFSNVHIWDTEKNNGVLIYLLIADRDFEILADRGIHQHVGTAGWERICKHMEAMFKQGKFEAGVLYGITQISEQLAKHYPANENYTNERLANKNNENELPDAPIVL